MTNYLVNWASAPFEDRTSVLTISSVFAFPNGANVLLVTGVAGKRIKVIGMTAYSNAGAAGAISLLDGSGGTVIYNSVLPNGALGNPIIWPIAPVGYFETTAGTGLYCNTAAQMAISITYVLYTP